MIDGFEMILELLAADGDALLDHQIGFDLGQRVSFNGVRGVGQLKVVSVFKVLERVRRQRAQPVKLRLLFFNAGNKNG